MARFKGNQRFTAVCRAPAPRPHPGYVPYLNRGVVAPGEQQRRVATAAEAQRVDAAAVAGVGPPAPAIGLAKRLLNAQTGHGARQRCRPA